MMNSAGARFFGKSVEEIIGKHVTELFPPDTARLIMNNDRRVITTGETHRAEEVVTAMGITRTILSTISGYCDPQGNVIGLVGIVRDISERKQSDQALRQSEARFRELAQREKLLNRLARQIRSSTNSTIPIRFQRFKTRARLSTWSSCLKTCPNSYLL